MDAPSGRGNGSGALGFGALLRALRLDRGLTQEELAAGAALSVRAVGDLERGRAVPHRDTVGRLCAALRLDDESSRELTARARTGWAARQRGGSPRGPAAPLPLPRLPVPPPRPVALPSVTLPPVTLPSVTLPSVTLTSVTLSSVTLPPVPPAQLPWDVPGFVGRDGEIGELLGTASEGPGGLWVIDGLGGVGKTALAVHVGHRLAGRFPDGQLYVDLRGFDLSQPPVSPSAALSQFLRALGAGDGRLPAAAGELTAMFRSALAGKRVLIVLDNAASAEQARALLPGAPGSLVLVTSRRRLSGLVARDGARRITLHSLDPGNAVALLTSITGPELARRDPGAAGDLARLCGCLPLALRIAGERARTEAASVKSLIADLADERGRLDHLMTDDESTSVPAVFSWSYHALEPRAAHLFRLLGLHPGPDFTIAVAAVLAGTSAAEARQVMGQLASAHLIERSSPGRYHFHDLMRVYAAGRCMADQPPAQARAAVRRLVRWYLAAAVTADRQISPQRYRPGLDEVSADHELPSLASYREAVDWCDAEIGNLVAAVSLAGASDEHALAWRLAWAMAGYLDLRRPRDAWLATHQAALASARTARDRLGEAAILTSLGLAYYYPQQFTEAEDCYRQAQRIWRELGDRRGEVGILNAIANIRMETRELDTAIQLYLRALAVNRALGDQRGEGVVLTNLAEAHCELGRFDKVLQYAPAALDIARHTRNQRCEVLSLCHLARAIAADGRLTEAEEHFLRAAGLARAADDRHGEAWTLDYLGTVLAQAGRPRDATVSWQRAAALFDSLRDPQAASLRSRLAALTEPGGQCDSG